MRWILLALLLVGCTVSEPTGFSTDFRESFVHYLTVDRPDGTVRDLYINPEAVGTLRIGSLPEGTTLVIDGYHAARAADESPLFVDGRLVKEAPLPSIHTATKRDGEWDFGSFDPVSGAPTDENLNRCFQCHQATAATDFVYTRTELARYGPRGEPGYVWCNLRGRVAC